MHIPFTLILTMSEDKISCVRQNTHFKCICLTNLKHIRALRSTRQVMYFKIERIGIEYLDLSKFSCDSFFSFNYFNLCHLNLLRFGMFVCSFYSTISNYKNQCLFTMFTLSIILDRWLSYVHCTRFHKAFEEKSTRLMYVFIFTM